MLPQMKIHALCADPCALLLAGIILAGSLPAVGEPVVFTIDPARSQITLSGAALGNPFAQQADGSLTTSFGGTVNADVTATSIEFTGGSRIDAAPSGDWEPLPGGEAGRAPADYGAQVSVLFGAAKAALRNIVLDATSAVLPLNDGSFDSSNIAFGFPEGSAAALDYLVTGLLGTSGSQPLEGFATNKVSSGATVVTEGGVQTLTLPVDAEYFFELLSPQDVNVRLVGQLVATAGGAEPWVFDARSIKVIDGMVTLAWQAAPGQVFRVESTLNLETWTTRASAVTSATSNYTWSGPVAGNPEFFRLAQ